MKFRAHTTRKTVATKRMNKQVWQPLKKYVLTRKKQIYDDETCLESVLPPDTSQLYNEISIMYVRSLL